MSERSRWFTTAVLSLGIATVHVVLWDNGYGETARAFAEAFILVAMISFVSWGLLWVADARNQKRLLGWIES